MPKITKQQQRRIAENKIRESKRDDLIAAIVSAHFGYEVLVEVKDGGGIRQISCDWRQNLGNIAVGDRVQIAMQGEKAVIEHIAERSKNTLYKRQGRKNKPIAANVEQLLIVACVEPACQFNLIDRYLIAAEIAGIRAAVVCNKSDIGTLNLSAYQSFPLFTCSTLNGEGIEEISNFCRDKETLICGQSGVGKSSLISALIPNLAIQIQEISAVTRLGKHTTTNCRRYLLPNGGAIVDTPGVRGYSFPDNTPQDALMQAMKIVFSDIFVAISNCRFSDCKHQTEPNCAVKQAIANGTITENRWESFQSIQQAIEEKNFG
ncbi:MAG: ribosome small subunit-dependent GTPase A [Cardiobacteriaceae bacterium]|nr:ribosome small subunit-dependent GTPase A [Cardiobacteriaceae bacterium]